MNQPLIIAHRGASGEAEDNSLEAFLLAAKQGADMIEMDVRVTKDQVLVLNHNDRLKRFHPGLKISSKTYHELIAFGMKFPKLEEVLEALPPHILINLDLKSTLMDLALKELINRKKLEKRIYFDTTNWLVLHRYQYFFPNANFILSNSTSWDPLNVSTTYLGRIVRFLIPFFLSLPLKVLFKRKLNRVTVDYVTLYSRLCTKKDVEFYHSLGIKVFVFTINKEENMRKFIERGVDGIKTDNPGLLSRVIHEMNANGKITSR